MGFLVNFCRIIVAVTFILSGFVKAIDPLGTQYKIEDYLEALGLSGIVPDWATLGTSIGLSAMEFTLGVMLLFAISRKVTSRVTCLFMAFMTVVTIWLYVADPVSDCGCFGDAIHLSNGETLAKNIVLLTMSIVMALMPRRMILFISEGNRWLVLNYSVLFILGWSFYSLYMLPPFDFRPYHIGANIEEGMIIPEGAEGPKFETTFLMKKDGETKEFTLENYPDSTWEFVDSKSVQVSEGYVPPIHDFSITTSDGDDITEDIITREGYTFLLISPYLEHANESNFGDIDQIFEYAEENGYPFYCLTSSTEKAIMHWQDITGAEYPFCTTDGTTLKTIIRSNPGLLLVKDGTIIQKWSHNDLPQSNELKGALDKLEIGKQKKTNDTKKIIEILLIFAFPLVLLSIADRTWAWTKWFRRKKRLTHIKSTLKNKQNYGKENCSR